MTPPARLKSLRLPARLARSLDWVSREKLEQALAYAAAYREEIAERLEREPDWTEQAVAQAMPWAARTGKP